MMKFERRYRFRDVYIGTGERGTPGLQPQALWKEVVVVMSGESRHRGIVTLIVGLALLIGGVMLPSLSAADPDGWSHRGGHGDFASRMLYRLMSDKKDLNLSEEQVGKIKAIALDYAKKRIRGQAEIRLADVDVRAMFFDEKADVSAIEAAIRKSESARTAFRIERAKAMRAAWGVLTPEQREKWRDGMTYRSLDGRHASDYEESGDSERKAG
jgi:Spy/CpxP family protein refolding chaperone